METEKIYRIVWWQGKNKFVGSLRLTLEEATRQVTSLQSKEMEERRGSKRQYFYEPMTQKEIRQTQAPATRGMQFIGKASEKGNRAA